MFHRCWAEIDLSALQHNLNRVRQIVGPTVRILFPVKADAYGHGLEKIAVASVRCGVDWLGVANITEAARIRRILPDVPILILGLSFVDEVDEILHYAVSTVVASLDFVAALNDVAKKKNGCAKVHLKVDTGMGRIGVWHEEAVEMLQKIKTYSHIKLEGLLTHFPSAEKPNDLFTRVQIEHFKKIMHAAELLQIPLKYIHLANSSGLFHYPESYQGMIRPGISLYGVDSGGAPDNLKPLLQLKSRVLYLKEVAPGRAISYGRTYITDKKTTIATLPIGYGDGYPRSLSNKAQVLIHGERYPVVGRVTMDQIMVDIGSHTNIKVGDEVTLIGQSAQSQIRVEEFAHWAHTIPYEILTNLGDRIHRVYL